MMEVLVCFGFCLISGLIAMLCKLIFDMGKRLDKQLDYQSNRISRIGSELILLELEIKRLSDGRKIADQA